MRLLPSSLLLLAVLPACPGDEPPDPTVLQIRGDRASLLAARQEADAWQKLTADATGKTSFAVDRTFELVGVCEDFGGEDASRLEALARSLSAALEVWFRMSCSCRMGRGLAHGAECCPPASGATGANRA